MPLSAGPEPRPVRAAGLPPALFDPEPFERRLDAASTAPLAVAFSGGGDSLALLLAAAAWGSRAGRRVIALHVDHGLQPQSGAWARQAQAAALSVGADFRLLQWTGPKPTTGLPAKARTARLTLLADAAREAGARVLLLGHTADDVREGEAMRALGSSLGHLREWSPSPVWAAGRGLFHFRPLLGARRADLRERLSGAGLDWIDDPANEDVRYARARARRTLAEDDAPPPAAGPDLPRDLPLLAANAVCDPAGGVAVDRKALRLAEPGARRAFVQMALLCAAGTSRPARRDSLDRLMARVAGGETFTATLCGARVAADTESVLFARDAGEARRGGLQPLPLPARRAVVWDGRFEVTASAPGLVVRALGGFAARLPESERRTLRRVPARLRSALPAIVDAGETMTSPILAEGPASVRSLVRLRLLAAAGLAATESQADALAHGANGPHVLFWGEQLKKASA